MATKGLVLVTGATGYIASHVVQQLLAEGYNVRGTVRSTTGPKVAHLLDMGEKLQLVAADLLSPDGWDDVVKDCDYCVHLASPFVLNVDEKDADSLIKPAVDGTLNVLKACARAGTVKRVVQTSSIVAIVCGWDVPSKDGDTVLEPEAKWSNPEKSEPYPRSKTLAEKAAWQFVADRTAAGEKCFELAVINPSFVIGPTLSANSATSFTVATKLLLKEMPAVPNVGLTVVDVRDVARAHVLAMTTAAAAGQRFLCLGEGLTMRDLALAAAPVFKPLGYNVPTGALPKFLLRLGGIFDKGARSLVGMVDVDIKYVTSKSKTVLGLQYTDGKQSFIDMCHSLIKQGVVPKTAKYEQYESAPAPAVAAAAADKQ